MSAAHPRYAKIACEKGGVATDRIARFRQAGVSIWLDVLSRDLLESGEFATLAASGFEHDPARRCCRARLVAVE